MRSGNSGLAHGTSGSPQTSMEQDEYKAIVAENESALKRALIDESLVMELEGRGEKLSRKDVVFVARDATGQIVWLETGGASAGLEHILHGNGRTKGHAADFEKAFGVKEDDVAAYLYRVVTQGTIVYDELKPVGKRVGFERVYAYSGRYHVVMGIGANGFIISAYPRRKS